MFYSFFVFCNFFQEPIKLSLDSAQNVMISYQNIWPICVQIGPLHDPVTWYGINYAGTQITQGTFKTKESRAGLKRVPLF